jgi:hypothetical protein
MAGVWPQCFDLRSLGSPDTTESVSTRVIVGLLQWLCFENPTPAFRHAPAWTADAGQRQPISAVSCGGEKGSDRADRTSGGLPPDFDTSFGRLGTGLPSTHCAIALSAGAAGKHNGVHATSA